MRNLRTRLRAAGAVKRFTDRGVSWLDKKASQTKSRSVKRNLLKLTPRINAIPRVIAGQKTRFLPGEVFIPLKQISTPELEEAFRNVRKLVHVQNHTGKYLGIGMTGVLSGIVVGAAVGNQVGTSIGHPGIGGIVGGVIGMVPGYRIMFTPLLTPVNTPNNQQSLLAIRESLRATKDKRVEHAITKGKANFMLVDLENNGIRLGKLPFQTQNLMMRLNNSASGIIVLDEKGNPVYPTPEGKENIGNLIPQPERRGTIGERRQNSSRRTDERKRTILKFD